MEHGDPGTLERLIPEDYQMPSISPESLNTILSHTHARLIPSKKHAPLGILL